MNPRPASPAPAAALPLLTVRRHPRLRAALLAALCLGLASHSTWAKKPRSGQADAASAAAATPGPYAQREDVAAFAASVAEKRQLPLVWVQKQLAQAQRAEAARRFIMPPPAGTAKNWAAYRARFIDAARIQAGSAFWRQNTAWLEKAEAQYGVPPELVVGIVGVETFYGRIMGNFRILDALATLGFDFPPGRKDRSEFFREQLEEFLVYCAREGISATVPKGSFAGAMGLPQFMPGSINQFAVDFDRDGHIDLDRSAADVVGSVAHFMVRHGWQRGMPARYGITPPNETTQRATLLAPDILPSFTAAQMRDLGAVLGEEALAHVGPMALVELQMGEAAPTYVAGTANFYAVTRYNWSSYYAMAVLDLAQEVKAAMVAAPALKPAPRNRD